MKYQKSSGRQDDSESEKQRQATGTSGSTQGEAKDRMPARNARGMLMEGISGILRQSQ